MIWSTSLPVWPRMETEVIPLTTFDERRYSVLSKLEELKRKTSEAGMSNRGRWLVHARVAFGLSIFMSVVSSIVIAILFAWPWLRASDHQQALIWLVAPHLFLRFIGISFFVDCVVSGSLP